MREVIGGVVINEVEAEPLSEYVLDFLTSQKKECPYLDFKLTIHIGKNSDFPEVAKDIFAFTNYGGGWILIGWKEEKKNQYLPVGVSDDYKVDQATLQEKFNSYSNKPIQIEYKEFNKMIDGVQRCFAVIYSPPSYEILKPVKEGKYRKGDKERVVFKKGDIFYRRGTQSIPPSEQELKIIKKRLEKENYRISVLSGEPDEIDETIYSNLFDVTKLPDFVHSGLKKAYDDVSIKVLLKQEGVFPEFFHKFKEWNKKIVTFENLWDTNNPYHKLVEEDSVVKEPIDKWIDDPDKNRIIVELLNRELKHYAIGKGMFHFRDRDKLYYPLKNEKRAERWRSRYGKSTRIVAAKVYAEQLQRYIYWHAAFFPNFIQLESGKFFFRILPTFVLTNDGKHAIAGFKEGTVITRLSYNKYNSSYLNNLLFWIYKLGDGDDIHIRDYLTISSKPATTELPVGIIFDIPSSEFRLEIAEESEEDVLGEDDEFEDF